MGKVITMYGATQGSGRQRGLRNSPQPRPETPQAPPPTPPSGPAEKGHDIPPAEDAPKPDPTFIPDIPAQIWPPIKPGEA